MDSDEAASEDEQEPAGVDAPEDCETVEAEGEEQVDVRVLEKPMMPSKAERDKHDSTHATYRTWCAHCVRGRGQSSHHSSWARKNNPSELPEIVMDYCFPSQEDEDAAIILGIKCRKSGATDALMLPAKGFEVWIMKGILAIIDSYGHGKVINQI